MHLKLEITRVQVVLFDEGLYDRMFERSWETDFSNELIRSTRHGTQILKSSLRRSGGMLSREK